MQKTVKMFIKKKNEIRDLRMRYAIADVLKRMDELEKELAHEKQLRKAFGGNN